MTSVVAFLIGFIVASLIAIAILVPVVNNLSRRERELQEEKQSSYKQNLDFQKSLGEVTSNLEEALEITKKCSIKCSISQVTNTTGEGE